MSDQPETIKKDDGIAVFSIIKNTTCSECGVDVFKGGLLRVENQKPLCLDCADMGHLVFLPSGNVALTRRSKKYSTLSAVVLRFSRTRGRYERQGLMVEPAAVERAEEECLGDEEKRQLARERAAVVREKEDERYLVAFRAEILKHYPSCPADEASAIAEHACEKYSGRVGRSAMAKELDAEAVDLAVRAHVRHCHTGYDKMLARGEDRREARDRVRDAMELVLSEWAK